MAHFWEQRITDGSLHGLVDHVAGLSIKAELGRLEAAEPVRLVITMFPEVSCDAPKRVRLIVSKLFHHLIGHQCVFRIGFTVEDKIWMLCYRLCDMHVGIEA